MRVLVAAVTLLAAACSSAAPSGDDPPGLVCEYHPVGRGDASSALPTREQLAEFDHFIEVKITGHRQANPRSDIFNIAVVEESVLGSAGEGDVLELQSGTGVCLETGDRYYLLIKSAVNAPNLSVPGLWWQFPVINNRITLHPDMRKDELIGSFHGLDPVLFKRRFLEFTGRTDIEVD